MKPERIPEVGVRDAAASGALLLDVREPEEWQAGHAPGAVHVPLGDLPYRVDELPAGVPILCICRSGNRSARATAWLRAHGRDATNTAGGMAAWATAGLPLVDDVGRPGVVA